MNNLQLNLGERIKDVEDFKGRFMITDFGRLFSINGRWKGIRLLKHAVDGPGYYNTTLRMKPKYRSVRIHQLVGEHFVDNPDNKPQLNHKDGNKLNNHYLNLEWCTIAENIEHAVRTGLLDVKGEKHHHAKLRDADIPLIFEMRNKEITMKDIGNHFGVCRRTIGDVLNRRLWCHVPIDACFSNIKSVLVKCNGENHHKALLTEKQVYEMHDLRKQGLVYRQIGVKYNISTGHAWDIINGVSWGHIYASINSGS